jgi:hypothetical protein
MLRLLLIISFSNVIATPIFSQNLDRVQLDSLINSNFVKLNDFTYKQGPFTRKIVGDKLISFHDQKLGYFLNYISDKFEIDITRAGYMGAYSISNEDVKGIEIIVMKNIDQISFSEIQNIYTLYSKIDSLSHSPNILSDSVNLNLDYYYSKIDSLLNDE